MRIELDHFIVPSRDEIAAAKQLAALLDVEWGKAAVGPFTAVYVNAGLTLDFQSTKDPFPVSHYCFRVNDAEFDAILARVKAAGIPFRSDAFGSMDDKVAQRYGGRGFYFEQPDGHMWEVLTASYARPPELVADLR